MKRNIFYTLMGGLLLSLAACSDNYEDASSKHVYGEEESPYVRTDADGTATVSQKHEFAVGHFDAVTIKLADYAEQFQAEMGMTVDEVLAGLTTGKVVFYSINQGRNIWDKTGTTKGGTGWYFNSAGAPCQQKDGVLYIDLDVSNKALVVNAVEGAAAGTTLDANVGFAIGGGPDYDRYVRFRVSAVVSDPSFVMLSFNIPQGDFASYLVNFNNYAEAIYTCMGMTVAEFCAQLDGGNAEGRIHMYSINADHVWDEASAYTANGTGYWMAADGTVLTYGTTGYSIYAECYPGDGTMGVGRAPGLATGSTYTIQIGFRDKTLPANFIWFRFNITLD